MLEINYGIFMKSSNEVDLEKSDFPLLKITKNMRMKEN